MCRFAAFQFMRDDLVDVVRSHSVRISELKRGNPREWSEATKPWEKERPGGRGMQPARAADMEESLMRVRTGASL